MAIRSERYGTDRVLADALYHVHALEADGRTIGLAEGMRGAIADLRSRRREREQSDEARAAALARLVRHDLELDERVRVVELGALAAVGKDRRDPRYRALFPRGLRTLVAPRGGPEIHAARALAGRLESTLPELAALHAEELRRLAGVVEESERAQKAAEAESEEGSAAEVAARLELVQAMRRNEGALRMEFPGNLRRVRSYFRPTRKRREVADVPEKREGDAPVAA